MALAANALTSVLNLKGVLDIKADDNTRNGLLELYINAASQYIERYCDRIFKLNTTPYVEYHSGGDMNFLMTRQYPIVEIVKIVVDNSRDFTDPDDELDQDDYGTADNDETIVLEGIFPLGTENIQVTYRAGYAEVPGDLEVACLFLAEWYYRQKMRGDMGRTSVSKGDESVGVLSEVPKQVLQIIDNYRRTEAPITNAPVRNR